MSLPFEVVALAAPNIDLTIHEGSAVVRIHKDNPVLVDETAVTLRPTELRLLQILARAEGRFIDPAKLMDRLYGKNLVLRAQPKILSVMVHRIREQLAAINPDARGVIRNVTNLGYAATAHESAVQKRDKISFVCGSALISVDGFGQLLVDQQPVPLSPKRRAFVDLLVKADGDFVRSRQLYLAIYPYEEMEGGATIPNWCRGIRNAMGAINPDAKDAIQSVRGRGYRLAPPETSCDQ